MHLNKWTSLFSVYFILLSFLLYGCSECDQEDPSVILRNNGTGKADIQIKTTGGNTENINNIEVGNASEKRSFEPGKIEFTISIQGVSDDIFYTLNVSFCTDYVLTINPDNVVSATVNKRD